MNEQDPFGDDNVVKLMFLVASSVIAAGVAANTMPEDICAGNAIRITNRLFNHLGIPLPTNSKEP